MTISYETLMKLVDKVEKSPNYLTMVIRGHFVIEQILDRALEKYSQEPSKELSRLPFALKSELAVVLGIIGKDSLPLFRVFNNLRNRFAHNPYAKFQYGDIRNLVNSLSKMQKEIVQGCEKKEDIKSLENKEVLWRCILAMFAQIHSSIKRRIRDEIAHNITMQDVAPLIEKYSKTERHKISMDEYHAQIEEEVKKTKIF